MRFIVEVGSYQIPDEWSDFRCTNTVYYQGVSGAQSGEAVAQQIADLYAAEPVGGFTFGAIKVRAYDFNGGLSRSGPPVAEATAVQAGGSVPGPREVAVCLSYRSSTPSTPRTRGRIFLGPVADFSISGEYVNQGIANSAKRIGQGLMSILTLGAVWSLYSRSVGGFAEITNFHVDNAWDTQRSRGLPATALL
jgi:hypothetical protein